MSLLLIILGVGVGDILLLIGVSLIMVISYIIYAKVILEDNDDDDDDDNDAHDGSELLDK
jgi:hypothetical protein